ncbi:MAG: molybdate transport system ATP-binding protein [Eubacteriaceae bacterium]|nr:molybdate transport system ATP-binding protein [Eubacteriaceae bacterium]MDK2937234.1 molybdate transport system ATP-binding protein [Eubacteriaceae bacterium]MDN5308304.1 molybdate transport system ATP-binding protein [Eubacteriaceae bacterium]
MKETILKINDYSIKLGNFSLKRINLQVIEGEIFALLGKTGSGKTILLESIAGFYHRFSGDIYLKDQSIISIPLEKRQIGYVYQDFGLFNHMTVYENIIYGLKINGKSRDEQQLKGHEMAQMLSIEHRLNQYPLTLSGGERQRTALARALIMKPRLLLMDEPFSSLDPATKEIMYQQIEKIHTLFNCTIIFVTHDFNEAKRMADRIGIMMDGELRGIRNSENLFVPNGDQKIDRFLFGERNTNERINITS